MRSLVETLDMPSQELARPLHPVRIARGIQAMAVGGLLWAIGTTAPMSGRIAAEILGRTVSDAITGADQWGAFVALFGASLGCTGFIQLARRDDPVLDCETGRAGRWMVFGGSMWVIGSLAHFLGLTPAFGAWFGVALGMTAPGIGFSCLAVQIAGGSFAVIGVRRMFVVLGQRCRRYRAAAHAQQSAEALAVAAAIFLVSSLLARILPRMGYEFAGLAASVIAIVSGGVLLMGMLYLLFNCWWIARAIVAPPPALEDVVHVVRSNAEGESSN